MVVLGGLLLAFTNLRGSDGGVPFFIWRPSAVAVFCLGAAFFAVGNVYVYRARHREADLDAEVAALRTTKSELERRLGEFGRELAKLLRAELEILAKELHYWSSERITLFVQDGDQLLRVARCSANQTYRQSGRSAYPLHEGCLGRALERGDAADVELPDPKADLDAWTAAQWERWQVPADTASELTMKSRAVIARRIDASPGNDAFGLIVFESEFSASTIEQMYSTLANRPVLDPDALEKRLKGSEGERLKCLLEGASKALKLGREG